MLFTFSARLEAFRQEIQELKNQPEKDRDEEWEVLVSSLEFELARMEEDEFIAAQDGSARNRGSSFEDDEIWLEKSEERRAAELWELSYQNLMVDAAAAQNFELGEDEQSYPKQ